MKLLITIVVYNQDFLKCNAYLTLIKNQINFNNIKIDYFIYDNSSINYEYENLPKSILYNKNETNPGVGAAYNSSFNYAANNNYDWVILSDQDTKYPNNFIQKIASHLILEKYSIYSPILHQNNKLVSPVFFKYFRGIPIRSRLYGKINLKSRIFPINSGLILGPKIFENFKYNEKAKLDFSDFIFFERLLKSNLKYFIIDILCEHDLSSNELNPLKNKLMRFKYYSVGLFEYAKENNLVYFGYIFLFARASLLNLRNKTFKFYFILNAYFK